MIYRIFLGLCFLMFTSNIYCLVESIIDEKNPISLEFSSNSHNRIVIEEGCIEKIFGDSSLFSITIDSTTGQAFINVLTDLLGPKTLTVVSNSGLTQDLLITTKEKPSELIILKEGTENEEITFSKTVDFHANTIDFLNALLEGSIPLGYGKKEIPAHDKLSLPSPLEPTLLSVFEGPFEMVRVYKITNHGQLPINIKIEALKSENDNWVFLSKRGVGSKDQSTCIISSPKEENP